MSSGDISAYLFASLLTPPNQGTCLIGLPSFSLEAFTLEQAEAQTGPAEQAFL